MFFNLFSLFYFQLFKGKLIINLFINCLILNNGERLNLIFSEHNCLLRFAIFVSRIMNHQGICFFTVLLSVIYWIGFKTCWTANLIFVTWRIVLKFYSRIDLRKLFLWLLLRLWMFYIKFGKPAIFNYLKTRKLHRKFVWINVVFLCKYISGSHSFLFNHRLNELNFAY